MNLGPRLAAALMVPVLLPDTRRCEVVGDCIDAPRAQQRGPIAHACAALDERSVLGEHVQRLLVRDRPGKKRRQLAPPLVEVERPRRRRHDERGEIEIRILPSAQLPPAADRGQAGVIFLEYTHALSPLVFQNRGQGKPTPELFVGGEPLQRRERNARRLRPTVAPAMRTDRFDRAAADGADGVPVDDHAAPGADEGLDPRRLRRAALAHHTTDRERRHRRRRRCCRPPRSAPSGSSSDRRSRPQSSRC